MIRRPPRSTLFPYTNALPICEKQIYRIDHYLGKETVQNVMVFRFANSIIEPLWNRTYIDHVQITAAETVGVEHRGAFYETAGALDRKSTRLNSSHSQISYAVF